MKILLCVKQVPGTNKVEVDPTTGVLKRSGVKGKLNPYDLFAIEAGLRLRERYGGTVRALTMGPPQAKQALLETVYMGADDAVLVTDRRFGGADVLATAYTLSQAIAKSGEYDVILCGKQTTDGDTAQVGAEVAEYMGLPHAGNVLEIVEVSDNSITVRLNQENEIVTQSMPQPCLLCMEAEINTPRLPSYRRKKVTDDAVVQIMTLNDFDDKDEKHYGLFGSATQVERIFPPDKNDRKEMFTGDSASLAGKLCDLLADNKFV